MVLKSLSEWGVDYFLETLAASQKTTLLPF